MQVCFSQVISVGLSVDELDKICICLQLAHITFSHMVPWKWRHVAGSDQKLTCILRDNGILKSYDNFPIFSRDEVALPVVLVMYCSLPQLLSSIHLPRYKLDQSNLNSHFNNQTIEFIDSVPVQLGLYQVNSRCPMREHVNEMRKKPKTIQYQIAVGFHY